MAESPIQIKDMQHMISSVRQEYFDEGNSKIIGGKGFVFKKFKTEKERIEDYLKERETINFKQNISQIHMPTKTSTGNPSKQKPKFVQPSMRFKARTDLERIFDTINNNYYGVEDRKVIEGQLNDLGLNLPKRFLSNTSLIKHLNNELSGNTLEESSNSMDSQRRFIEKRAKPKHTRKVPKINNAQAKFIRSELHNKTHFKGAMGYTLFDSGSTFSNQTRDRVNLGDLNTMIHTHQRNHITPLNTTSTYLNTDTSINNKTLTSLDKQYLNDADINKDLTRTNPLLFNINQNYTRRVDPDILNFDQEKFNIVRRMAFENIMEDSREINSAKKKGNLVRILKENKITFIEPEENNRSDNPHHHDTLGKTSPNNFYNSFMDNREERRAGTLSINFRGGKNSH